MKQVNIWEEWFVFPAANYCRAAADLFSCDRSADAQIVVPPDLIDCIERIKAEGCYL